MAVSARSIQRVLRSLGNEDIAAHSERFFKTGKGQYGEGDVFLGIRVPEIRQQAKKFRDADVDTLLSILTSRYHDERLFALVSLVDRYRRGDTDQQQAIYEQYLGHTRFINNWDLVDSSASQIVGAWLEKRSKDPLYHLCDSPDLWERRIAIISTFHFIRLGQFHHTLEISRRLIGDDEDLIHKAVGWMLREVGKRDQQREAKFLDRHYHRMPRTMLRYAIEKFPEEQRQDWLQGKV